MRDFIFGYGYLGCRIATRWLKQSDTVYAATRKKENISLIKSAGLQPVILDVTEADSLQELPEVDRVVFAVGYDRSSGRSIDQIYVQGLANVLKSLPDSVQHFVYVSSTGVYAQSDGGWVDETSACLPIRPGGKACLAAEQLIRNDDRFRQRSTILRFAGIYGPQRVPNIELVRQGQPIPCAEHGYLNLIHVDDAATIVDLVSHSKPNGQTFLVSDGQPVERREFYLEVGRLLERNVQFIQPADDSNRRRRADSNKRCSNQKLLGEFPISFQYPSYRQGLASIVGAAG